ncbi:hypothetical protein AB0M29_00705 [Streptomyces sp. NPDC051976]|uniref:hypothetical protein n=1 Tax=Streptomyces sp. NPDC051976 TaxID=3154947 RepID=UPI00342DB273
MGRVRTVTVAGALLLVTGCGVLHHGGDKAPPGPAPKPAEVIDAMRADVVAAVRAAMPGQELSEPSYDHFGCKSSMWRDTSGSSKVVQSESAGAVGTVTDKRSADELIEAMVKSLTSRGWTASDGASAAARPGKKMAKHGIAGTVQLGASRFTLSSGKTVPMLNAVMSSDCLPNPDTASKS